MICSDERLRASDHAVALLYARALRGPKATDARIHQRRWLAEDRARCATIPCLLDQYKWRLDGLTMDTDIPSARAYQSAEAEGTLLIASLQGGWHLFRADALWTYPGGQNANIGEAAGVFRLRNGKARFYGAGCHLAFERLAGDRWRIVDDSIRQGGGAGCGGLNVSMTGTYRRSR